MNIMDSITTLIVEDEPMLAEILVDNIKQFPQFDVIGIADKLESARKQLRLYICLRPKLWQRIRISKKQRRS